MAILGLPSFLEPPPEEMAPVVVQVVNADELKKLQSPKPVPPRPAPKPAKKAPPKPEPPQSKKPVPPPPVPEPPPQEKLNIPKPEPIPAKKPKPKPKPKPVKKVPPKKAEPTPKPVEKPKPPKPAPKPAKKEPPKKTEQAKAEPTPLPRHKPKPPPDAFQSLLRNLAKEREQRRSEDKKKAATKDSAALLQPDAPSKRSPLQQRMLAASLARKIMSQISPCWNIPAGAKGAANMTVAIRIRLNPDGALGAQPQVEDSGRMSSDLPFRTLAESALRALRDPSCMPLKLPYGEYDVWKDITFVFDPREALGQ